MLKPKSLSTQTKHLGPARDGALALKLRLVFVSVTLTSVSDPRGHSRPLPEAQRDVGIGARSSRCSGWSWQPLASSPALGAPQPSVGTGGQCSRSPAHRDRACTTPGGSLVLFALLSGSSQSLQGSLLLVYDGKCVTTVSTPQPCSPLSSLRQNTKKDLSGTLVVVKRIGMQGERYVVVTRQASGKRSEQMHRETGQKRLTVSTLNNYQSLKAAGLICTF